MELFYETPDGRAKLYLGDARQLPVEDESIDMIATSPPYWGKRDYGEDVVAIWGGEDGCGHEWGGELHRQVTPISDKTGLHNDGRRTPVTEKYRETLDAMTPASSQGSYCSLCGAWRGQLGLEPTWQEYISHLCECAEEWWRVLKPTGNLFVNQGDTFAGSGDGRGGRPQPKWPSLPRAEGRAPQSVARIPKMKLGIPFRLRFALNDMGWVSRDDIIWYKGKEYPDGKITKVAMPESVKDRMSCSYEMLFHFVKEPKGYWFDLDSVRRPLAPGTFLRISQELTDQHGGPKERAYVEGHAKPGGSHEKQISGILKNLKESAERGQGANPGDVWIIQPEPFKEKHYACWPSKLCERMIKVGCPKEVCPKCGKPRERMTVGRSEHAFGLREREAKTGRIKTPPARYWGGELSEEEAAAYDEKAYAGEGKQTVGWSDCGCGEGFVPGVALDPFFGGSYRIAKEALKLGRNVIGIDMKEEYLEMGKDISIYGEKGLSKEKARRKQGATQGVLI